MGRWQRMQAGFGLVEMMVAVAVLFVIAAIAIPLYRDYVETSRQAAIQNKAEQLRAFQDNFRLDTGSYAAGIYDPTATPPVNDFNDPARPESNIGFRVDSDTSDFAFEVEEGDCGDIGQCYRLVVTRDGAAVGVYERSSGTWVWP